MGFPASSLGNESICNAGNTGDEGLIIGSGRFPGGGHGNLVQYSCVENPMDRGAQQAIVYRLAKSWTPPKWLKTHTHTHTQYINYTIICYIYVLVWLLSWVRLFCRLLCPWDFWGKNTGVGCHFHSPGHLPNLGTERRPLAMANGFFTTEPPEKSMSYIYTHLCMCFYKQILVLIFTAPFTSWGPDSAFHTCSPHLPSIHSLEVKAFNKASV